MNKIILHIPHSSTVIPCYEGYLVDEARLKEEQQFLTDWYTDDLFSHQDGIAVIAKFSRLFCDVERFEDDDSEIMSRVGMGVLYEKLDNGSPLRKVKPELRARIIREYYTPHHKILTDAVESQLKQNGKAIIIDCHSFPDVPLKRDLNLSPNRPDYCIGTDDFHTSDQLVQTAQTFFDKRNLTVGINTPYSGSMVPMKHYNKDNRVQTLMLEINRRLYIEPNRNIRSVNYPRVKEIVNEFVTAISQTFALLW